MNTKDDNLKFIDFCAGIGGGRVGLEILGMQCVGFSEIDKNSEKTYRNFFGETEKNYGDLMKINPNDLPEFDVMIAGFPCQTFSVIGQRQGMKDDRGQIIYGLIDIMKAKNLKYFILENVKGLLNHDGGLSMKVILDKLDRAGYKVFWKLTSSLYHGVPQMRERIYFVGIRKDLVKDKDIFEFPEKIDKQKLNEYLVDTDELELNEKKRTYETFLRYLENKYNKGKFSIENLLKEDFLVIDTRQSDLRLYRGKVPTLRTGRHGILYIRDGKFRKLSGCEALSLQGFPKKLRDKIKDKISDMYLLGQAGNAMTVNVASDFGKSLLNYINNIMKNKNLVKLGSKTAKSGFKNEQDVIDRFNDWENDKIAQKWLNAMNYDVSNIEYVKASKVLGQYKADIQVKIRIVIKLKSQEDLQNLQVKLVSNPQGFNQVDKRWVDKYVELWNIPNDITKILKLFTGEIKPTQKNLKDSRRMLLTEMSESDQKKVLKFFEKNKILIVSDLLKGRGEFSADWVLVILKVNGESDWVLKSINEVMNIFGSEEIRITNQGSLKIGKIGMQRKGGDNGRDTAKMLQFKINPVELFNNK